jgi:hypothetical protein
LLRQDSPITGANTQSPGYRFLIQRLSHRSIEGAFGNADNMITNELAAFAGAVTVVLEAALQFQRRPAAVAKASKAREDGAEIDLAVAGLRKRPA